MTRYDIRHETHYAYAGPVQDIACTLRLKPVNWPGQKLVSHRLEVSPEGFVALEKGLACHRQHLEVDGPTDALTITSHAVVEVDRLVPLPSADDARVGDMPRGNHPLLDPALCLGPSPYAPEDPAIALWAAPILTPGLSVLDGSHALALALHKEMTYAPGTTHVATLPSQAFGRREGVCQDYAQILIVALRAHGVPAAYVSGYIPSHHAMIGADASHAWVLVWAGERQGWVGLDPTNALWMADRHVVTAAGRDYGDVAPVTGVFLGPPGGTMDARVEVREEQFSLPLPPPPPRHN